MIATSTPVPLKFSLPPVCCPVCKELMHDTRLPLLTAKNKSFGFSIYSISLRAATRSTICSGSISIAYSFRRLVSLMLSYSSGKFCRSNKRSSSSVPLNFTITSQFFFSLSNPTSSSSDFSRSSPDASSARFNRFSIFSLGIKTPATTFLSI